MRKIVCVVVCCALMGMLISCGSHDRPDSRHPVTLTIWHTYVEQMGDEFKLLVEEFNDTIGAKQGIVMEISAVSNSSELNQRLLDIADRLPGAAPLPDLALIYPQIAILLSEKDMLTDLGTYFSESELLRYVPHFLEEGRLGGKTLYLMPVAKSTEVLYVNRTLFDRYAAATGADIGKLSTFEGIMELAKKYYEWSGGKAFYYPDNNFNYAMIGLAQLGESFLDDQKLNMLSNTYERIWNSYYRQAVFGGLAVFDKYGNYIAMTGDVVCCTSTSAGAIYYPDRLTYADNTKEDVVFDVLQYPVFEGGEKIAIQRGAGFCVFKTEQRKEYAAAVFLKWLTEPEQNLKMTSSMGYLPVTTEAFNVLRQNLETSSDNKTIQKMLHTATKMQDSYEFFAPQVFDKYDALSGAYNNGVFSLAKQDRTRYLELIQSGESSDSAWRQLSTDSLVRLMKNIGQ